MNRVMLMALAAAPLLLAGCGTANQGLESVHQPVVERSDLAFDVATSGYGLAPGEAQRLAGWMASLRLGYGDRVAVDDPASGNGGGVREAVAAEAARYGMLVSDEVPITAGEIAPGSARIIISRMTASVPGCPDHSRVAGIDFEGHSSSNFGCANNTNLAAMVARPEDLVRGMPGSDVTDPMVSDKAIRVFRGATPTGSGGLKTESSKGGQ